MTETTEWITRAEAASRLGVQPRTIDNYLTGGKLTKYKDGRGRVWIDAAECTALLTPFPAVHSANR